MKWTHPYAIMILLVISELYQIQPLIPRLLVFCNIYTEHVFKIPIGSFRLSIRLRMICKNQTNLVPYKFNKVYQISLTNVLSLSQIISRGTL